MTYMKTAEETFIINNIMTFYAFSKKQKNTPYLVIYIINCYKIHHKITKETTMNCVKNMNVFMYHHSKS